MADGVVVEEHRRCRIVRAKWRGHEGVLHLGARECPDCSEKCLEGSCRIEHPVRVTQPERKGGIE